MAARKDIYKDAVPFKKGESGNPNGRPKGVQNSKTRLKRLLELTQNATNPITGKNEEFTVLELMDAKLINIVLSKESNPRQKIAAYKEVLDRFEGKAIERVAETDIEGNDKPIEVKIIE